MKAKNWTCHHCGHGYKHKQWNGWTCSGCGCFASNPEKEEEK